MADRPAEQPRGLRITLRQLEAFRAVVITGSVSRAAERMAVSQPSVSRLIADLEEAVGFRLFERDRGLRLSVEGRWLLREVELAFVGMDKITRRAEDIRYFRAGHLRVAASPALSLGLLPMVLEEFRAANAAITVSAQVLASQSVAEWVATGQIDVGFAALPISQAGVTVHAFAPPPVLCVVPHGHPLSRHRAITPALLSGEQILSLGPDSLLRRRVDQAFEQEGVVVHSSIETTMSAQAALLASRGLGVAIIDPFTVLAFKGGDLVLRPFKPIVPYDFAMLLPEHGSQSRLTEMFIGIAREHVARHTRKINAIYQGSRKAPAR